MNLIFDMDGTLADTAMATVPAIRMLCEEAGWDAPTEGDIRAAIGTPNPEFYYRLFPALDREAVFAFGQRVEAAEEDWVRRIGADMLFPGVRAMLDALAQQGVPMHIASTGDTAHVEAVLGSAGIKGLFQSIHCHEPEKAAMVGRIVGDGSRGRWAMVGDRDKDYQAARANGIMALGAGFGYCEDEAEWDAVFQTPGDLVEWVRGLV